MSHAIRRLEEQIGVRLLTRTTRSVSPTDAGEQLLAHLRPALADIRGTLTTLSGLQTKPVGRVRLLCPSGAKRYSAKVGSSETIRIRGRDTTGDSRMECGRRLRRAIHFGEFIAKDWWRPGIADIRHAIVGAHTSHMRRVRPDLWVIAASTSASRKHYKWER